MTKFPHLSRHLLKVPTSERPVKIPHFRSKGWVGKVSPYHTFDLWEWEWFAEAQPLAPSLLINGNGSKPFARFWERTPDNVQALQTLERYLDAMRAHVLFHLEVGPEPAKRGPLVSLIDGDTCNLLPSNRLQTPLDASPRAKAGRLKRKLYSADWSAGIRIKALADGRPVEEAWREAVAKWSAEHGGHG